MGRCHESVGIHVQHRYCAHLGKSMFRRFIPTDKKRPSSRHSCLTMRYEDKYSNHSIDVESQHPLTKLC